MTIPFAITDLMSCDGNHPFIFINYNFAVSDIIAERLFVLQAQGYNLCIPEIDENIKDSLWSDNAVILVSNSNCKAMIIFLDNDFWTTEYCTKIMAAFILKHFSSYDTSIIFTHALNTEDISKSDIVKSIIEVLDRQLIGNIYYFFNRRNIKKYLDKCCKVNKFAEIHEKAEVDLPVVVQELSRYEQRNLLLHYFESAINGDVESQVYLGRSFANGINGASKNPLIGELYLKLAAKANKPEAQFLLGHLYSKGKKITDCGEEALYWWNLSSENDYAPAQYLIGLKHLEDNNIEEAKKYFITSADKGYLPSCFAISKVLHDLNQGYDSKSLSYLKEAAAGHYPYAMHNLAVYYLSNCEQVEKEVDVTTNRTKAIQLLIDNIKENNYDESRILLGNCIVYEGVDGYNPKAGFDIIYVAAQNQNHDAELIVGQMYYYGIVVEKDYSKAFYWYKRAADHGNTVAFNMLGVMYASGRGVERNIERALFWYKKAADKGFISAIYNVGLSYEVLKETGDATEKDIFDTYSLGVTHNSILCEYKLGQCYENGIGTKSDNQQAYFWYSKAAEKKFVPAIVAMAIIIHDKKIDDSNSGLANKLFKEAFLLWFEGELKKLVGEVFSHLAEHPSYLAYLISKAEDKNENAMYILGVLYCEGRLLQQDPQRGINLLLAASKKEHSKASLCIAYEYSVGRVFDLDIQLANTLFYKNIDAMIGGGYIHSFIQDKASIDYKNSHSEIIMVDQFIPAIN